MTDNVVFNIETYRMFMVQDKIHTEKLASCPFLLEELLNNETPTIYGDGEQTRDCRYMYLDVVDALLKSSESEENLFLNIGTGVETSVNELVSILSKKISSWDGEPNYEPKREGELLRSVLNYQRAKDGDWLGA